MYVKLENPGLDSVSLPPPFQGILRGGTSVILPGTAAQAIYAFGGEQNLRGLRLSAVPRQPSSPQAQTYGFDSSVTGVNGSAPVVITLLDAGHAPGFYELHRMLMLRHADDAGIMFISHTWNDPLAGNASLTSGQLSLVSDVPVQIPDLESNVIVRSSGSAPVTMTATFQGIAGSPLVDIYGAALLIHLEGVEG